MALKKISLTVADRRIISNLFIDPGEKADLATARQVVEVRRRLGVQQADRLVDRLDEGLRGLGMLPLSWDDLNDVADRLADIDDRIRKEEVKKEQDTLKEFRARLEKVAGETEFTIDDAYLRWLRSLCVEKDWKKAKRRGRDGGMQEIEVAVHPSLLETFVGFVDKVEAAIAAREETE